MASFIIPSWLPLDLCRTEGFNSRFTGVIFPVFSFFYRPTCCVAIFYLFSFFLGALSFISFFLFPFRSNLPSTTILGLGAPSSFSDMPSFLGRVPVMLFEHAVLFSSFSLPVPAASTAEPGSRVFFFLTVGGPRKLPLVGLSSVGALLQTFPSDGAIGAMRWRAPVHSFRRSFFFSCIHRIDVQTPTSSSLFFFSAP